MHIYKCDVIKLNRQAVSGSSPVCKRTEIKLGSVTALAELVEFGWEKVS